MVLAPRQTSLAYRDEHHAAPAWKHIGQHAIVAIWLALSHSRSMLSQRRVLGYYLSIYVRIPAIHSRLQNLLGTGREIDNYNLKTGCT
jgi:hypothetical protein